MSRALSANKEGEDGYFHGKMDAAARNCQRFQLNTVITPRRTISPVVPALTLSSRPYAERAMEAGRQTV